MFNAVVENIVERINAAQQKQLAKWELRIAAGMELNAAEMRQLANIKKSIEDSKKTHIEVPPNESKKDRLKRLESAALDAIETGVKDSEGIAQAKFCEMALKYCAENLIPDPVALPKPCLRIMTHPSQLLKDESKTSNA